MRIKRKRERFSEIEMQVIEESIKRNISPAEIARSLGRDGETVRKKIWRMGFKIDPKFQCRKLTEEQKQQFKDRKKATELQELKRGQELRKSIHPYIGSEWKEILVSTGSKIGDFRGQSILMMHGNPTTTQEILARYKVLMEKLSAQDTQEAVVVETPCQAKN